MTEIEIIRVTVFDIMSDRPTAERLCYRNALDKTIEMLRAAYPDRSRDKIFYGIAKQEVRIAD